MKIASVVLDIQSNQFSKPINYAWDVKESPDVELISKQKFDVEIGCMVVVPFGKQYKLGFVVDIFEDDGPHQVKNIVGAISEAFFTKQNVELARYISKKYLTSMATCLRLFVPSGAAAKLKHSGDVWTACVHNFRDPKEDYVDRYVGGSLQDTSDWEQFVLTEGQETALNAINKSVDNSKNDVYVLDGVTGSGKTEAYIRAIENVLYKGKTACVLVPEISLTPQTVNRFRTRFGNRIAVLHSKMTPAQRYSQFKKIKEGTADVVIGARSALFSPLKNIGLIVIDEEQENSYKQDKAPRYRARDCAEVLASQQNSVLVLGSATPSLEALYNCVNKDNWTRIELLERTNKKPLPNIEVVDMGMEFKGGSKDLFSHKLRKAIIAELNAGNKILLFHNRRGFASYMFCRNCGYTPTCKNCSTTLTYHQSFSSNQVSGQKLTCHHCGANEDVPVSCPECGSPYIAKYGAGTQSVEDSLNALISSNNLDARVVRMDADTTKESFGHQKCLEEFAKPGAAVLLGTQMIAKGLDFEDVTLVGVVLVDTNLNLPDFRASERTFDLILQVAGRAGRGDLPGSVIIQTYNAEDEAIECASSYDKKKFLDMEFAKRRLLNYPPYANLCNILISGKNEDDTYVYASKVQEAIESHLQNSKIEGINIMPATSCVIEKIRNQYRFHILIKSNVDVDISEVLEKSLSSVKRKASIKLNMDIDPINLF